MSARGLSYNRFDQNEYIWKHLGLSTKFENNWCAMCATPLSVSNVLDIELYPSALNEYLKQNERKQPGKFLWGKNKNEIIWNSLSKLFPFLSIDTDLWNGESYPDIKTIRPYAVVTVDGNQIRHGYQSHFLMFHHWKEEFGKIVNAYCFDPFYGTWNYVNPLYGQDIKKTFHSIINVRRKS